LAKIEENARRRRAPARPVWCDARRPAPRIESSGLKPDTADYRLKVTSATLGQV